MLGWIKYLRRVRVETDALKRNKDLASTRTPLSLVRDGFVAVESYLATTHAEIDHFDDAWRCIGEAMTEVETTEERWCEVEVHRMAGEIALRSAGAGCSESGSVFRACARGGACPTGEIMGAARRDEHGAALARSGQTRSGLRSSRPGLWLVHRRLRHARS